MCSFYSVKDVHGKINNIYLLNKAKIKTIAICRAHTIPLCSVSLIGMANKKRTRTDLNKQTPRRLFRSLRRT